MDGVTNKGAIIVAVIGAVATIIAACIGVSLQKENVVLINDNTAMQNMISTLESRIAQLEQAKSDSVDHTEEISQLTNKIAQLQAENTELTATVKALQDALNNQPTTPPDSGNAKTDTAEQRDLSQSVGVHTLFGTQYFRSTRASDDFKDYGTITDNRGGSHTHSINCTKWNNEYVDEWAFYIDLDYQYKKLSGVLFQNEYYSASPANTVLTIKKDYSTILWEGTVNGNSDAVTFEVDITGMRTVSFYITNVKTKDQPPAFFEAYLWK